MSPSPSSNASGESILFDASASRDDRKIEGSVDEVETKRILGKIFPKYHSDVGQCATIIKDLADARNQGQVVPRIAAAATGSFTAAGHMQRVYLVLVGECGAPHARNGGSSVLLVVEGEVIVAKVDLSSGNSLAGIYDVDVDGRSEVLVTHGVTNQGQLIENASLLRIDANGVTTVQDFGVVLEANCGGSGGEHVRRHSVIRVKRNPGGFPLFQTESVKGSCK